MNLEFREFNSESALPEQRKLFKDAFPEDMAASAGRDDHYQWKFHGFPSVTPSYEFAAWDEGKLVGYYAALPYQYVIAGKKQTCGMVCDVMTHSSTRGQGVFTKLGRYSLENLHRQGVDFVSGYPIRPAVLPGHLKVGWSVAFELPLYVRVVGTKPILKKIKFGFLAKIVDVVPISFTSVLRLFYRSKNAAVSENAEDFLKSGEYDEFFKTWSHDKKNYLVKNASFLKWRLGAPRAQYRTISIRDGAKLVGVAIVRQVLFEGIECLVVLDMMVLNQASSVIYALHAAMVDEAKKQNAALIVAMMSKSTSRRLKMARNGFFATPKKFKLILNQLTQAVPRSELMKEENWDLMWIDSDDN